MRALRNFVLTAVLTLSTIGLALTVTAGVASASPNLGNSLNAQLCQQGGWQNLEGSNGTLFANDGACVSYGAHGGTIIPIPPTISVSFSPTFDPNYCNVHLTLSHFEANTFYPVVYSIEGFGSFSWAPGLTTNSTGGYNANIFSFYNQDRFISFTIGGVTTSYAQVTC
ncbi:MAG: hypothetical protein EPN30_02490 [Actinomycetota bacterium]|nr:MAG: hypothetical protein EPN30_02490 [Actinomycetota bacterium]